MNKKPPTTPEELLRIIGLDEDFSDLTPQNLASIPQDQWMEGSDVIPPDAIQRYLDSDDILTDHTIDMMEEAMDKAFGCQPPWSICSFRNGSEADGNLSVQKFYLLRLVDGPDTLDIPAIIETLTLGFKR